MLSMGRSVIGLFYIFLSLFAHSEDKNIPEIVQSQISEMNQTCEDVGGKVEVSPDLLIIADITGDGFPDYIINEKKFLCEGSASLYSSSGGSQIKVYIGLANGSVTSVFEQNAFDVNVSTNVKPATIELVVGGVLCGQNVTQDMSNADLKVCWRPLYWNSNTRSLEFSPLSKIKPFKPI